MKKLVLICLALFAQAAVYGYISPSIQFPEYTVVSNLSPNLKMFHQMILEAREKDKQDLVLGYILNSQEPERYDILMDLVLKDLRGTGLYGKSVIVSSVSRELAISNVMMTGNPRYVYGYAYILKFDTSLPVRQMAARAMGRVKKKEAVDLIAYLLHFLYNPKPFDPNNVKMDREDRVAEELVRSLGEIGSPACLPVLLQIVNVQNHRRQTIDAAWESLSRLKIESYPYRYFILSLKDSLSSRNEQVSPDQLDQVNKTVATLVKFIRDNFEKYNYTEDDVDMARGTLKDSRPAGQ